MRSEIVLEIVVVALAKKLKEPEDGASEVGVVEVLLSAAVAAGPEILRFVRSLEGVQIQNADNDGKCVLIHRKRLYNNNNNNNKNAKVELTRRRS